MGDRSSQVLREVILEEANVLFEEQQTVNEDEYSRSDDPMDADTTSRRLLVSNILTQSLSFWKESCFQQKCKLLLVITMESYSSILITFKIL